MSAAVKMTNGLQFIGMDTLDLDISRSDDEQSQSDIERTLVDALAKKYKLSDAGMMTDVEYIPGQKKDGKLQILVFHSMKIHRCGSLERLTHQLDCVNELDLAENCLADWREVVFILESLPELKNLNLCNSPLHGLPELEDSDQDDSSDNITPRRFHQLRRLILNDTGVQWMALLWLLGQLPNLEELHLSRNDFSDSRQSRLSAVHPPDLKLQTFCSVHVLHANECGLASWEAVHRLVRFFPTLETFVAAGNAVPGFGLPDHLADCFGCLQTLNINGWRITSWTELDKIGLLPMLSELRMKDLPVLEEYTDNMHKRSVALARFADITVLNGSIITESQREDAERWYIRHHRDWEVKPTRFYELEKIHGKLSPLVDIDLTPIKKANVSVIFDTGERNMTISLEQTVAKFKQELQRIVGLTPDRIMLYYKDIELEQLHSVTCMEELRLPRQMLWTLNVVDGDKFIVMEKPKPLKPRTRKSSSGSGKNSLSSPVGSPTKLMECDPMRVSPGRRPPGAKSSFPPTRPRSAVQPVGSGK